MPCSAGKLFPIIDGRTHVKPCGWEGQLCVRCAHEKRLRDEKEAEAERQRQLKAAAQAEVLHRIEDLNRLSPKDRYEFLASRGWTRGEVTTIGKKVRITWWMPAELQKELYPNTKRPVYQTQTAAVEIQTRHDVEKELKKDHVERIAGGFQQRSERQEAHLQNR